MEEGSLEVIMSAMIAFCGLDCSTCEAYIATQANDEPGKQKLLEKWRVEYNSPEMEISAVICDGCHATTRLGGYCSFCNVRKCALGKGLQTCADCPDFACEELQNFFVMVPQAKANLEALRG
jgi:hypothetical protein